MYVPQRVNAPEFHQERPAGMSTVSCMLISCDDLRRPHKMASNRATPPKQFHRGLCNQALKIKNEIHRKSRTGFRTRIPDIWFWFLFLSFFFFFSTQIRVLI